MGLKRADRGTVTAGATDGEELGAAGEERPLTRLVRPEEGPSEMSSAGLKSYVRAGGMLALSGGVYGRLGEGAPV